MLLKFFRGYKYVSNNKGKQELINLIIVLYYIINYLVILQLNNKTIVNK
jgi:hypothetical protein